MKTQRKSSIYAIILPVVLFIFANSCEKDNSTIPELTTAEVSNLIYNSAVCGGNITFNGGASIQERGVCWSTNQNPTIADNKMADTLSGDGSFTVHITNLASNTTFYVRAYATNSKGTSYGNQLSFTLWLNEPGEPITDVDGNVYSTVKIGTQLWMKENLKTVHYKNNDPITYLSFMDDEQWINSSTGAYCFYDDNAENGATYGPLYNWYAVADSRGISPAGWHIPTSSEWQILFDYLGGDYYSGNMIKSLLYWENLNPETTNESGFSALPGGFRMHPTPDRTYTLWDGLKLRSFFWAIDQENSIDFPDWVYYVQMQDKYSYAGVYDNVTKNCGLSIRCVKD